MRARRAKCTALLAAILLSTFPTAAAPQDVDLPAVLQTLTGEWEGSGVLFGNPAAFRMVWTPLEGSFVRLSFTNLLLGENQDTVPVLHAEATYLFNGTAAVGVWLDDRPQQLTLSATANDTSVVTEWVAPAERGRTEYVVNGQGQVVVRDYVMADGAPRLFSESTYTRSTVVGR